MFTESGTWDGGSVELLCLFRHATQSSRSLIHRAVWSWPSLVGPYANSKLEPEAQLGSDPTDEEATYGVALLPGQIGRVAFQTTFVEDSNGVWLYAGVPLGSLGRVLPVGAFPFGEENAQEWEHIVYGWLFGLAEHLHSQMSLERAVIGWLTTMEVEELAAERIPEVRHHGYIAVNREQLVYYPPNRTSAVLE
jgi:hypothetical protein